MKTKSNFIYILIGFLVLIQTHNAESQNFKKYVWQTLKTNGEPIPRHEASFVEANGKFYLLGGRKIQEVSIFDPETNTWTSGAKPPIELHHFQGFSYKGDIYVAGAQTGVYPRETSLAEMYVYRTATNNWEKGPSIPKERVRGSAGAVVYKDKLYMICGIIDGHWDGHVRWFDCYNFKTGKWETLTDAPRPRDHFNAVVCNNKLYLIGGRVTSGSVGKVFDFTVEEVDVYDFKTGSWSTLDNHVPTPRAGSTTICINNRVLFTGGESTKQKLAHNEVECLDTKTGKWSALPSLITGRHGTQLIWYKKKLFIASGCGAMGGNPELTSIECFSEN